MRVRRLVLAEVLKLAGVGAVRNGRRTIETGCPCSASFRADETVTLSAAPTGAGELVGGIFYHNYPGGTGLTSGSVFGKIAGTGGAADLLGVRPSTLT